MTEMFNDGHLVEKSHWNDKWKTKTEVSEDLRVFRAYLEGTDTSCAEIKYLNGVMAIILHKTSVSSADIEDYWKAKFARPIPSWLAHKILLNAEVVG